jgi:hypothetical protein
LVGADLADPTAPTFLYCYGADLLIDLEFNKTGVEPFRWSVSNASGIDPSSDEHDSKGKNVSDTPVGDGV